MNRMAEEVSAAYLVEIAEGDVPVGYKKTEVGVVPEDWNVGPFGKLFEKTSSRKALRSTELVSFVGMQDVTENARLKSVHLVNFEEVKAGFTYFEKKDVLVAKITPCFENGKGCSTNNLPTNIGFGSTEFHVLRAKDHSDADFIYFWTTAKTLRTALESEMVGSAGHRRVPLHALQNYVIPYPKCKHEQFAIAKILSGLDLLMEKLEALILKKQAIKAATMEQLLTGRTRLPQFAFWEDGSPKRYKSSELGEIPEDWDICDIQQSCDILTGYPFPSEGYSLVGFRLLRGANIQRDRTDWSEQITSYWPEVTADLKEYELKSGDIVISMDGSLVGKSFAQLTGNDLPALLLQRVARLRAKTVYQSYLKEWICSSFFIDHCDSLKTVTAIPHISPQDIKSFKFFVPRCEREQIDIATVLSELSEEVLLLEKRLDKTRQLKQGMMQQLLTGKIRLLKASTVSAS